jgi:hypothetical protein
MAQSGFTPVQLYRSTTAAAVPLAANLAAGELAINLTDEKLYFENASGVVKVLADSTYVGTVTSVAASGGTTGLTFTGSPITSSGTLTLSGTLAATNGGTGQSSYAIGDLLFASTTTALSKLADVATGNALISGGVGVAPLYGKIGLTTHVSGTLAVGNGGTGATTLTANGVLVGDGTSAVSATAVGTTGQVLVGNTGAAPTWATLTSTAVTSFSAGTTGLTPSTATQGAITLAGTLAVANGGTGVTTSTGTGSVVLSASPSFTGTVNFGPAIVTGSGVSTGDAQFELGGNRSGDGPAYMDFHAVAGGDFNARVFRGSGANGNMEIVNAGTGVLSIATNAAEKMRITDAGNVGIGTTAPAAKLDVIGTIYSRPGGAAGAVAELTADASSGANGISLIAGFTSGGYGPIKLLTSATERMRIDSSGNLVVGTTSSSGRLTVETTGSDVGYFDTTDTTGGSKILAIRSIAASGTSTPTLAIRQWRTSFAGSQNAGEIRFDGLTTTGSYAEFASIYATSGANSASGAPTAITFQTMNASYVTGERMRIDSAGNVMVGTTSATGLFSVNGVSYGAMIATDRFGILGNNLYYGTGNFRYIGNGHAYGWTQGNTDGADLRLLYAGNNTSGAGAVATTSERIYITSSGFVGVGTSTDNGVDKLTVAGIVGSYISGRAGFHLYNGGATAEWFIGQPSASSHNLTFSKLVSGTYTDYVAIDSTGLVGIGNTSPTVTLDVTGGIKTSRTAVTAPATSDGNIFSGTYTPTLTNVANIDIPASTAYTCQYMRVGDVVTVSGRVSIVVTGTGLTRLNMTLPIASNFSAEENCAGTAQVSYAGVSINLAAQIKADATNDRAQILYYGNVTGAAQDFFFTFTYRII